ncbi:MAG: nucleotidyltransferase domain-containing protein [Proteobacteria bacterium]|nr:nucleotidyltransferase domain-containing protein [Pseudomonadota bacterium]MBU4470432.1 nucleotidyltransferase domain-containing protein [Pseudomonadota bacterium]MCG2753485.1 nucleotidyltransferase domain-containing protein [Desulfobacteraceae bacterium]
MDNKRAPEIVIKYVDFIRKEKPQIKKVYLFGSYVKNQHHPDSDVDLAVVFENITDSFETQVELMKMRRNFDTKIEPHVFLESDFNPSNPLANEVLKHGIRLN